MQETYERTDPERRVLIRYEEMRADPRAALQRICATLGVEASPDEIDRIVAVNDFSRVPKSDKGAGREIRRAEPGGWNTHMSSEEILEMHEILAEKLDELGYLRPGDIPTERAA